MYVFIKFFEHSRNCRIPPFVSTVQKDQNNYCKSFEAICNCTGHSLTYYGKKEKRNGQYLDSLINSYTKSIDKKKIKTRSAAALRYFRSTVGMKCL